MSLERYCFPILIGIESVATEFFTTPLVRKFIMKKINMAVALLMAFGVAACGSNGGGGNDPAPNTNSVQNTGGNTGGSSTNNDSNTGNSSSTNNGSNTNNASNTNSQPKTDLDVAIEKVPTEINRINKQYPFIGSGFETPTTKGEEVSLLDRYNEKVGDEQQLRSIQVDGKVYEIFPSATAKNITIKSDNMTRLAQQGTNTLVAIVKESGTPIYMFFNAINPTKDIEVLKGSASYEGVGYHVHTTEGSQNPNVASDSVVKLTADFGNKYVKGTVSSPKQEFNAIEIGGHMTNNAFQGKVNDTTLIGGFFGDGAQEAVGRYVNLDEKSPSYGVFKADKK